MQKFSSRRKSIEMTTSLDCQPLFCQNIVKTIFISIHHKNLRWQVWYYKILKHIWSKGPDPDPHHSPLRESGDGPRQHSITQKLKYTKRSLSLLTDMIIDTDKLFHWWFWPANFTFYFLLFTFYFIFDKVFDRISFFTRRV